MGKESARDAWETLTHIPKREEIQIERQYNLDLLRALATVAMIICHAVFRLGAHRPGYHDEFLYFLGDTILGEYLAVAHAFMFAMGVCILYTRKGTPRDLIRRGIRLYLLGYVLNFCRYGIYALADGLITGEFVDDTLFAFISQDILQFAGLALVATGVFRKLKLRESHIFVIGLLLSAIAAPLPFVTTGYFVLDTLIGHFITTVGDTSCFPFCNWYLFVAAGMLFGAILRRTEDLDRFYRKLLTVCACVSAVYIAATFVFGDFFLSKEHLYYAASPLEAAGLLSIDLCFLSMFHFLLKRVPVSRLGVWIEMSMNMTPIYFIHWCILGFIESIFCYLLEMVFSYWLIYAIGVMLIIVSFFLARLWRGRRDKKRTAKR